MSFKIPYSLKKIQSILDSVVVYVSKEGLMFHTLDGNQYDGYHSSLLQHWINENPSHRRIGNIYFSERLFKDVKAIESVEGRYHIRLLRHGYGISGLEMTSEESKQFDHIWKSAFSFVDAQ